MPIIDINNAAKKVLEKNNTGITSLNTSNNALEKVENIYKNEEVGLITTEEAGADLADAVYNDVYTRNNPKTIGEYKQTPQTDEDLEDFIYRNDLEEEIADYTAGAFSNVAQYFRRKRAENHSWAERGEETAKAIEKLVSNVGNFAGMSYRGGTIQFDLLQELDKGTVLRNVAPTSTSTDKDVALDFAFNRSKTRTDGIEGFDIPVVYEIDNKYKAQYNINPFSDHKSEKEVLAAHNTLFNVEQIEDAIDPISGKTYKKVKLSTKLNDPEVLTLMRQEMPTLPINDKVLSFAGLSVILSGLATQQAEANPLTPQLSNSLATVVTEKGLDPYSDDFIAQEIGLNKGNLTDTERLRREAIKHFADKSKLGTSIEQNILSSANKLLTEVDDKLDGDWISKGRDEWFKENEAFMSPEMIEAYNEAISEGQFVNQEQTLNWLRWQINEEAATMRLYSEVDFSTLSGWGELGTGLLSDTVTGLFQPADVALNLFTLGGYKAYKTTKLATKAWDAKTKIGAAALYTSAYAVASEESRQYLAGVDLNDTATVAAVGFVLGGSVQTGVVGWQKMTNSEQTETLQAAQNYNDTFFKWTTENPIEEGMHTGTPKVPNVNLKWNPSPLIALYGTGNPEIYNFVSKIAPSFMTLRDDLGNPVVQTNKTAWEITDQWVDSHYKTYETKLQSLQAKSGLKSDEFGGAVTMATRQQADLYKAKKLKIDVLEERLKTTENPQEQILIQNELEIVKAEEVQRIEFDNPEVQTAVELTENFFIDYNKKFKELELNKTRKELEGQEEGMDLAEFEEMVQTRTEQVNKKYDSREKTYFSRFWDKDKVINNPNAKDIISDAIKRSPLAESYRLYDPDKYADLIDEADEVAENMIDKIRKAETGAEIDILSTRSGQGDITKAKSDIGRKIDVAEELVMDLTKSDIVEVTHAYAHDNGHKIGIREALGVDNVTELKETFLEPLQDALNKDTNLTQSQKNDLVKDLDVVLDTAAGTRYLVADNKSSLNTFKRGLLNVQNAWYSAGMGELTLSELGTGWKVAGREFLTSLLPGMKKVTKDYFKKGYSTDDLIQTQDALDGIALGTSVVHSNIERRYGDGSIYRFEESDGLIQKSVEATGKVANIGFHIGGMNFISSTIQYATAMGLMKRVHRLGSKLTEGGKLSRADEASFARWGLSKEDIQFISTQRMFDDNGNPNYSMDDWDTNMKEKMYRAMWLGAKESVLMDNPYALPRGFTDPGSFGSVVQILGQYSKHPIMSYNALFKNGWNDKDARTVASALFSFGILANALYWREQIAIELGWLDPADAEFDIDTEEGQDNLVVKTASTVPHLFFLSKAVDTGAALLGTESYSGYTPTTGSVLGGAVVSVADKVRRIAKDSEIDYEDPEYSVVSPKVLQMIPIANSFPLTDYWMKNKIEEIDYEGWTD